MFVFDTSSFIDLFKHFYPDRFPSLWTKFGLLVASNKIVSVREVEREIESYGTSDRLSKWAEQNQRIFSQPTQNELVFVNGTPDRLSKGAEIKRRIFSKPTQDELVFVKKILEVPHFQTLISKRARWQGKPVADPFVIAKAKIWGGCVVTEERQLKNAAKIPNVCDHFNIPCTNLEGFMKKENWVF